MSLAWDSGQDAPRLHVSEAMFFQQRLSTSAIPDSM
jgi:hypothetical protein